MYTHIHEIGKPRMGVAAHAYIDVCVRVCVLVHQYAPADHGIAVKTVASCSGFVYIVEMVTIPSVSSIT